jgi:hypothetical protein
LDEKVFLPVGKRERDFARGTPAGNGRVTAGRKGAGGFGENLEGKAVEEVAL